MLITHGMMPRVTLHLHGWSINLIAAAAVPPRIQLHLLGPSNLLAAPARQTEQVGCAGTGHRALQPGCRRSEHRWLLPLRSEEMLAPMARVMAACL